MVASSTRRSAMATACAGDGRNSDQCLKGRFETTRVEHCRYLAQTTRKSSLAASRPRSEKPASSSYVELHITFNVQAFIRRASGTADKTSCSINPARMAYGDSIVKTGRLEVGAGGGAGGGRGTGAPVTGVSALRAEVREGVGDARAGRRSARAQRTGVPAGCGRPAPDGV